MFCDCELVLPQDCSIERPFWIIYLSIHSHILSLSLSPLLSNHLLTRLQVILKGYSNNLHGEQMAIYYCLSLYEVDGGGYFIYSEIPVGDRSHDYNASTVYKNIKQVSNMFCVLSSFTRQNCRDGNLYILFPFLDIQPSQK